MKRKYKIVSEINITPFVDVLLVILVIFMVTAPMMKNGFDVDLPKSSSTPQENSNQENIILSIDKDSNFYFDEDQFSLDNLQEYLTSYAEDTPIFIKADKNVAYQSVISLMSQLNQLGFLNISLMTDILQ